MPKDQVIAATINLGSNSFRLLVGIKTEQGLLCLLKKRATVRLQWLTQNGSFTSAGIQQTLEDPGLFRAEIDRLGITTTRCCGPETFRKPATPEALTVPAVKSSAFRFKF